MPIDLSGYRRVETPIEVTTSPGITHIEQAILSSIAGLEELRGKVNANDTVRTTKQNAMVTAVESAINDLYSKYESIGNMSATDLENLESLIKSANDIVSNGVNGLVKAIDSILKELNQSKQIEFVDVLVDDKNGVSVDLPIQKNEIFIPFITYINKPHNAQEVVGIFKEDGVNSLSLHFIDTAHFASAKVKFDCTATPIELKIGIVKDRVNLLSFEIEKPTESLEDSIDAKDSTTVGAEAEA